MRRPYIIFVFIIVLCLSSCGKQEAGPLPQPVRELSIPEKVEKEMMDVLSKDWKSLSDTLAYFDSTMLSKGITKGKAPDGVYYELSVKSKGDMGFEADFKVADSIWMAANGQLVPLSLSLKACNTEIVVSNEKKDSISLSVSNVKVIAPMCFLIENDHQAPLLYKEQRVGYLTREMFENTDYSTGLYIVVHYYGDPRTFAIYDNGLCSLLKKNPEDVIK